MSRPALSADKIIAATFALIDKAGIEAFSYRILAANLGCQAMSLYHYFPSKQHLFEALVDRFLTDAADFEDEGPWPGRLRHAALAWRDTALTHPGFYPYVAQFRLNNAAGLALLERHLRIFQSAGLPARSRARHFRAFGFYLNGACLEAGSGPHSPSSTAPLPFEAAADRFPGLMEVAGYFAPERRLTNFQHGLEALIRAIEAEVRP